MPFVCLHFSMSQKAAHIISDRQKKGALASLKKPKPPKNVLVNNEHEFWPCLSDSHSAAFEKLLETHCNEPEASKHLTIGLQSTLRHLKAGRTKMLVLANETSPRWFAKHLIAMSLARNQHTNVVIVPKLKDLTKKLLKTPAIVLGVMETAESAPLEEFYRNLGVHDDLLANYRKIEATRDVSIKKKRKRKIMPPPTPVVLLRKTSNSLAFFSMDTDDQQDVTHDDKPLSSDFIGFSKLNASTARSLSNTAPVLYRPIKIKQIAGNPKRKK